MSRFAALLQTDRPLVTAELNPPKGVDLSGPLAKARGLRPFVDAFNVTDSHGAVMTQGGIALARMLVEQGMEPILQVTCRDRNRIALQADMLAAASLGVQNLLCMTGDDPRTGDHPQAKPVFDMDAITLVKAADGLRKGQDLMGNRLKDVPQFLIGAVVNLSAQDLETELARMEQKLAAGCSFFQSQATFDAATMDRFQARTQDRGVPILVGIFILRSAAMARRMSQHLPGVHIPDELVRELEGAQDPAQKGVEIAGRLAAEALARFRGVHLMAFGQEQRIPEVLERVGLTKATRDVSA